MREFKFRVWFSSDNTMDYAENRIPSTRTAKGQSGFALQYDPSYESSDKVMQYTGLKDKNNKEIYEGDIVKIIIRPDSEEYIEHVEDIRCISNLRINQWWDEPYSSLEILGNIYENPELIKEIE